MSVTIVEHACNHVLKGVLKAIEYIVRKHFLRNMNTAIAYVKTKAYLESLKNVFAHTEEIFTRRVTVDQAEGLCHRIT